MKKLFTIITLSFLSLGFSQTSIEVTDMGVSMTVTPNGTVNLTTSSSGNTNRIFDLTNISANTQTYVAIRYDYVLNASAAAYFCFGGTCFTPLTVQSGSLVLGPGESASQSTVANTTLSTDLDEGPSVGFSHIKYTFRNAANPNDSVQFNLMYNNPAAGIRDLSKDLTSVNIYPNPAKDNTTMNFISNGNIDGSLNIVDITGKILRTENLSIITGKNNIAIKTSDLTNGTYFLQIKTDKGTITQKLIVKN